MHGLPTQDDGYDCIREWRPARFLAEQETGSNYALLVLNQPLNNIDILKIVWKKAQYRIAADGGGNRLCKAYRSDSSFAALMNEIPLETIHGDLDSLSPQAREWANTLKTNIVVNQSQDSTDFEKCISYIRDNYVPRTNRQSAPPGILVLGGLGGRVDQSLSVLHHLYKASHLYSQGRLYLLTTQAITFLLPKGVHRIVVRDPEDRERRLGKHIGILPLGGPARISTEGLEWDVTDWETCFGGNMSTSNHVREDVVRVETDNDVLFTIDLVVDED